MVLVNGGEPGQSNTFVYILGLLFIVGLGFSLHNRPKPILLEFRGMNQQVHID